ncbi:MAG: hypothetical protein LBG27_13605, partial [Spirochaetaceae bacterium]|nr:hypothetical protein [Spirochaetaceae bacterium]
MTKVIITKITAKRGVSGRMEAVARQGSFAEQNAMARAQPLPLRGFAASRLRGFAASRLRGFAASRLRGFAASRLRG